MQAQPAATGRPAVVVHDTTAAAPSTHTFAPTAPAISQPAFDRWTDLPVDVVVQVMYWTMRSTASITWATSFALTSKHFMRAGLSFRAGSWYREAQSAVMHERTVDWVCAYLKGFGDRASIRSPKDIRELDQTLQELGNTGAHSCVALDIETRLKPALGNDHLQAFRNYRGASLALLSSVGEESGDRIAGIARALPTDVCLRVQFIARTLMEYTRKDLVVSLIRRVALTGRATAFELKWAVDLSTAPALLGDVLDVACGPGMVSFLGFGNLDDPQVLLRALSDRCPRFVHLKLLMFHCSEPPARDALETLAAALGKRQSAGRSRLTVVIGCEEMKSGSMQAASMFSTDERTRFESVGLYFEMLDNAPVTHPSVQKVLRSLGAGAVDAWIERSHVTAD